MNKGVGTNFLQTLVAADVSKSANNTNNAVTATNVIANNHLYVLGNITKKLVITPV